MSVIKEREMIKKIFIIGLQALDTIIDNMCYFTFELTKPES